MFSRRVNCINKSIPPYRTGDLVGILQGEDEPQLVKWLGIIDRNAARRIPGAKEVALDLISYQPTLLDHTDWIKPPRAIVGCLIDEGAMAVMDGQKPLVKTFRDLGPAAGNNSATPT